MVVGKEQTEQQAKQQAKPTDEPATAQKAKASASGEAKPEQLTTAQKAKAASSVETTPEQREHLRSLVRSFNSAMLITRDRDGCYRSRPMAMVHAERDGELWFATNDDTPKVDHIEHVDDHVSVTMMSSDKWLTLCGKAKKVADPDMIQRLFSEEWRVWFPQGPNTPSLCLLHFEADQGEYWDQSSLADKMKFYYEMGVAYIQGRSANPQQLGEHAKISL